MAKYEIVKVPQRVAMYKLYRDGKMIAHEDIFALADILQRIADTDTVVDDGTAYSGAEYKELLNE